MISKITELYILCGHIQVSTEKKNSLVLKWFQRWQNHAFFVETFKFQLKNHFSILMVSTVKELTSFVGTFKSQLKNTDYYWNDYKDDRPLHSLLGHSSFKWKKLTSFIGTFKIQLEKTVHYPNDFKDDRTLHHLWGHSNSNWKRQFSIEMISKITELYILWGAIQIPTEKDSLVLKWLQRWQNLIFFEGTFKFRLIEPHIFCWDIQSQLGKTV